MKSPVWSLFIMGMACIFPLSGCKKDTPLNPVPMTKAISGQEAPCENLTWGGFPRLVSERDMPTGFICREGYALNFNTYRNTSDWVVENLTSGRGPDVDDQTRIDVGMPKSHQVTPEDYRGIGYQKGFFAQPTDFSSPALQSHGFYLTNIFPQHPDQAPTWESLEKWVQAQASAKKGIFVISGPIYKDGEGLGWVGVPAKPNQRGFEGKIQVPTATYKIVIHPSTRSAVAFIVPNGPSSRAPLGNFIVPVATVEEQTGLIFFPDWPENEQKALKSRALWR